MPFVFEYITPGSPVEQTPEHQQAIQINQGLSIGSRVVDHIGGAAFYILSTESNDQRPPGEALLFYKGQLIKIRAYFNVRWVEGLGDVATYRIYSLDMPAAIEPDRDDIVRIMAEALEAKVRSYPVPPATVKIEFI